MKSTQVLKIIFLILGLNLTACHQYFYSDPGSSFFDGDFAFRAGFRKIDMSLSVISAVPGEPATKGLLLVGNQVNANLQLTRPGSFHMAYGCDIRSFTLIPRLRLLTRDLEIDVVDATQVNCLMGIPVNTEITVLDSTQANLNAVLGGSNLTIRNTAQVNLRLAMRPGILYNFDIQGFQINNFGSCAAFSTTSTGAPRVTVQSATQVNITCIPEGQAGWINAGLTDPDQVPLKADDGRLLF